MALSSDLEQNEAYRLVSVLLDRVTDLIITSDRRSLLDGLCRSLVEASEHILLAWVWIGPAAAREVSPQIYVGAAQNYAEKLTIRRTWLTQRGPVFRVLAGADYVDMAISPHSLYGPWRRAARQHGFREAMALKAACPDTSHVGVIVLYADEEGYFERMGRVPFLAFARGIQSILYQCALREQLTEQATTDPLTGIPNRRGLLSELRERCMLTTRRDSLLAVGMLDLDNLKTINDHFGHAVGDLVLQRTAQRIQAVLRTGDQIVRLGGDEFALIVGNVSGIEDLEAISERILNKLKQPIQAEGDQIVETSASLGWTLYPFDDDDPDTLLRHADSALYQAKREGKDQFILYTATTDDRSAAPTSPLLLLSRGSSSFQVGS
ncbi:GGDEF domain-containing protein, partial [Acidithiobacillus caldus]|uniref:diguanylate cyclase domain-containing protein n=1 Tax=Acidithiobacillus caldus TaxID=33059 RepID=UPI001C06523F|nr:GGDEF domain-containing protein [Acidithiobacillus caldus]